MVFTPIRKFSEKLDLFPILQDSNIKEEAIKWAWFNAFSTVLCRDGITISTPILGYKKCTEDGTMNITLDPKACTYMQLRIQDPMLGSSISIGIEAKRLKTKYSLLKSEHDYMRAAFAQRIWYDNNIYNSKVIDVIGTCTESYFAIAYKYKNSELFTKLTEYYDTHANELNVANTVYKDKFVRDITKNIVWEPIFRVDDNLSVEDILSKIFNDLLNGSNT